MYVTFQLRSGFFSKAVCKIVVHWRDKCASPFATHISNFLRFGGPWQRQKNNKLVKGNNGVLSQYPVGGEVAKRLTRRA